MYAIVCPTIAVITMPLTLANRTLFVSLGILFAFSFSSLSPIDIALALLGITTITRHHWLPYFKVTLAERHTQALYAFLILVICSALFLPESQLAFTQATLYLIGLFFLINYWRTYREALWSGYCLGATLTALIGCLAYAVRQTFALPSLFSDTGRLQVFFSDPNVFGAFLVPALISALVAMYTTTYRVKRILYALPTILLVFALILTVSRGAWINALISIAAVTYILLKYTLLPRIIVLRRLVYIGLFLATIAVGSFAALGQTEPIMRLQNRITASDTPRIENLERAYDVLVERSFIEILRGSGNGSYEIYSYRGFSAHNTYLRVLIENGAVGLVILLLFLFLLLRRSYRSITTTHDVYAIVLFSTVLGILAQSFFIDTLHFRHLWLILALL